jgi:hypothetical protein
MSQLVEKMTNSNFKRVKADAAKADQQAGSQIDWAARRSRWVLENDSSVHRADTSNFRGGPFRGHGRWPARGRGGRGGTDRGGRGGSAGGNKGWWGKNNRKNPY